MRRGVRHRSGFLQIAGCCPAAAPTCCIGRVMRSLFEISSLGFGSAAAIPSGCPSIQQQYRGTAPVACFTCWRLNAYNRWVRGRPAWPSPLLLLRHGFDAAPENFAHRHQGAGILAEDERAFAMARSSVGSTSPELLRRVAALSDNPAWGEFFVRYDPFVRARCSVYGLDSAFGGRALPAQSGWSWRGGCRRISTIPAARFAAGCRRLCHHRAIDLLRERRDDRFEALDGNELIDGRVADWQRRRRRMTASPRPALCYCRRRSRFRRRSGARSSRSAGKRSGGW